MIFNLLLWSGPFSDTPRCITTHTHEHAHNIRIMLCLQRTCTAVDVTVAYQLWHRDQVEYFALFVPLSTHFEQRLSVVYNVTGVMK